MTSNSKFFGQLEGTGFDVLQPEFENLFVGHARVDRLWSGARWAEGPVWFGAGRYLLWSDIPNNRIMKWDECSDTVSVFREPANNSNGNTVDNYGRLVSCEHLTRQVTRTEFDGSRTVIADRYQGKRLNSPNDVVVKSDDSIWFTDPSYGILSDYEGIAAEQEQPGCYVYRVGADGEITVVADDFVKPNGLAFSADEQFLYVADTGVSHDPSGPKHIRSMRVNSDGNTLSDAGVLASSTAGLFDGFRVDKNGYIWTSAADGVHCLNPAGELLGKIRIPELVANVTFGGAKRNRLFICGTTSLYAVYLCANGSKLG